MSTKSEMAMKVAGMDEEDLEAQKKACSNWLLNWTNFQHYTAQMFEKYPLLPLMFEVVFLVRDPEGDDAQFVSATGSAVKSMFKAAMED